MELRGGRWSWEVKLGGGVGKGRLREGGGVGRAVIFKQD